MSSRVRFVTLLITLILTIACFDTAFAQGGGAETIVSGDFTYSESNGEAWLMKYTGNASDVTVPSRVNDYPVVGISQHAFKGADSIKTLTLSEGIASIDMESIFQMDNLKTLNLPSTLNIPAESTEGVVTGLAPVPGQCPLLEEVTVAQGNPFIKAVDGVLFNKDMTSILYYPSGKKNESYTIPDGVKVIGSSSFEYCTNIKTVIMPDTVEYVGYWAFSCASSLQEIDISESARTFGQFALHNTALQEIYLPASVEDINLSYSSFPELKAWKVSENNKYLSAADGVLFDKDKKALMQLPEKKQGQYTVPDTVTNIWQYAAHNTELSSIRIPQSAAVGSENFEGRPEDFTIYGYTGSSAETYAKNNGIPFVSVGTVEETIVDSGTCGDFMTWTFSSTGVLRISGTGEMTWECTDVPWEEHRPEVTKVIIEEGPQNIASNAFNNFGAVTEIQLASSIKVIGANAFISCEQIKAVEIPEGVKEIGAAAFAACENLEYAVIPASVELMDQRPFVSCERMKEFRVSKDNKVYKSVDGVLLSKDGKTLFQYPCGKAGVYTVPDTVETIDTYAFLQASATGVVIPNSVKAFGSGAFNYATIKAILTGDKVPDIPAEALTGCSASVIRMDETIKTPCDAGLHSLEAVPYKAPTCTEAGHYEYYKCTKCGGDFDEWGDTVKESELVIPPDGHTWDDGKVTKEPTYTEEGVRTYTCEVCKKTYTKPISKLPEPLTIKAKLSSLKAGKGAITVKWSKLSAANKKKITGFQIQYSLKKNFSGAKTVKAGKSAVSKKISKLKKKKVYYVRIRTYCGSRTGPWSAKKKIKTK